MDPCGEKNPITEKVLEITENIEAQVDAVIEKFDNLDTDDISKIRRDRLAALRKELKFKEEWIANGHGEYTTLSSEQDFFEVIKKSERVVLHCFHSSTMRCAIVDKHMEILAKNHLETKFCKLDVEKAPFLTQQRKIIVIPSILLCDRKSNTTEVIAGFDDFGGIDDFTTEIMEWRLAKSGMVHYEGDLSSPPDPKETKRPKRSIFTYVKKNIRGAADGSDTDSGSDGGGDAPYVGPVIV